MSYTNGLDKPTDYFNTVLYTGNGGTQNITGLDFAPNWVWIKERTSTSDNMLYDAVRGATNRLESNTSDPEASSATQLNAFNSDGWTTGSSAGTNESGQTYASWNWLAGGSASSNTDGSITSTVSANTTAGFSIVSYTGNGSAGATVGHGLGVAPKMIIAKVRSTTEDWPVYHASLGATKYVKLSSTGASETETSIFNDTEPTSSVFSLGTQNKINKNNETFIAYCFAEKKGYSKFGSYVGNNNDDGTFVYLGFKPAFVLIKITSGQTDNWIMQDNKRNTSNLSTSQRLRPNTSGAEFSSSNEIDLLSNGFKCHGADGEINGSGFSYIYMAFAESPFVTSTGIPTTAR